MRTSLHSLTAFLLFTGIIVAYAVMAAAYPIAFIWATYEDLYGEWAQTYLFAAAFMFSAVLAISRRQQRPFFALLAIACLYVVMEEISWGQRIIGFETPDILQRHNLQKEANLHNLLTGPVDTWIKRALEYLLAAGFVAYGLIYPILVLRWPRIRCIEAQWLPAPPLYLWPFFLSAAYLELGFLSFNEAEIAEVLVGAVLALLCGHYWLIARRGLDPHRRTDWPLQTSARLALLFVAIVGVSGALSASTTRWLQSDPVIKADTGRRLLNGYEKFAGRYADRQRWRDAADLYLRVHKAEPARTSVMRRLAEAYRNLGDIHGFNRYNQMSLDILLARQAVDPHKVSTHLSLGRTYRQRGIVSMATQHVQRAHALAMQRYVQNPSDAGNAYWLANTYKELGDLPKAARYYQEAFEAEPDSTKYRKAYYAMQDYAQSGTADDEGQE